VAEALGRRYVLVDSNEEAVAVMRRRLPDATFVVAEPPRASSAS